MNYIDHTQKETISQVIKQYSDLGLQPVPLIPNQKYLNLKDWSNRSIESLWAEHWRKYDSANIGFRMGNGILVIDCDSVATSEALLPILKPFNPPIVETTTKGHHHVYFRYDYEFNNANYIKLKGKYSGEIRFGVGAQCVAPPSQVNGSTYTLVSGAFENIPMIPSALLDLLLASNEQPQKEKVKVIKVKVEKDKFESNFDQIEVPLDKINIAQHIKDRIEWLKTAYPRESYTDKYKTYDTRSDVEFSVIIHLIQCGYTEQEIYEILLNTARKGKGFDFSYSRAQLFLANHPTIDKLQNLYFNLPELSFMATLIIKAVIATGVQFKTLTPSLTKSKISEITGIVDYRTIDKYLQELEKFGLIFDDNSEYRKFNLNDFQELRRQQAYEIDLVIFGKSLTDTLTSARIIGEVGLKVLSLVKSGVKTAKLLAEKLGKKLSSIYYTLNKLVELGLLDKNNDEFTLKLFAEFVKTTVKKHTERIKELIVIKRQRYEAFLEFLEQKNTPKGIRVLKSFLNARGF